MDEDVLTPRTHPHAVVVLAKHATSLGASSSRSRSEMPTSCDAGTDPETGEDGLLARVR
jgi:hypothetical protein